MNKPCTIKIYDEINCQLFGLEQQHTQFLYNKLGIFKDGHQYTPLFQLKKWDGRIRFFDKVNKTYVKILDEIVPYLEAWGYDISIDDVRPHISKIEESIQINEDIFNSTVKLRPYQVQGVNDLLAAGYGFGVFSTGAGKTLMCAAMAYTYASRGLPTLIIVPSSDLITQTIAEFKIAFENLDPLISVGEYSGSLKQINNPIVVATWQSLNNAPHYMEYFKAVIVDECHGVTASVIRELINNHGRHIYHRFGITGTMPKDKVSEYNLKISIGQVISSISAKWLIENKYLSEVEIQPIETHDEDDGFPDYPSEKAFLSRNDDRLTALAIMIIEARNKYGNTLVLVNTIAQGTLLSNLIEGSVFLSGASDKELRQENYKQYADRDDVILIATSGIASTGISIDRIFCLFLIDAGKSFVRAIQSIGRGLRRKGDKNKVFVKDVYSKLKFSKKHFKDRAKWYKEAQYPITTVFKYKYLE